MTKYQVHDENDVYIETFLTKKEALEFVWKAEEMGIKLVIYAYNFKYTENNQ